MSRVLAGPYASQLLADLGATVWKIESLQGDDTRRWGPPFAKGESAYFLSVNRGKKSLALNLKDPRGQAIIRQLAQRADVLLENFKVGDLARYGLDYPSLSVLNPALIYCSITGFGQSGPRAQEGGYDAALQGLSGLMSMTGEASGPPSKVGVAVIDVLTGLHAAVGILAALQGRQQTGKGQYLDLALLDVALASLVNQVQATLLTGENPTRLGSAHPQIVPYQAFACKDGFIMVAVGNDQQYQRLTEALGQANLWQRQDFQTNAGRVKHREELVSQLSLVFAQESKAYWIGRLSAASVPVTPVNNLTEALNDPQVAARNLIVALQHPTLGSLPGIASPLGATAQQAPPLLGQDSRSMLQEVLGFTTAEITALEDAAVILCA